MNLPSRPVYLFGIISDTHGYLPEQALAAFRNVDLILHAGDIGSPTILLALENVAPVVAVRGNMDARGLGPSVWPKKNLFRREANGFI